MKQYDLKLPKDYDYWGYPDDTLEFITKHNLHEFLNEFYKGVESAGYDVYQMAIELKDDKLEVVIYARSTFTDNCLDKIKRELVPGEISRYIDFVSVRD